MVYRLITFISIAIFLAAAAACSGTETKAPENKVPGSNAAAAAPSQVSQSTPAKAFAADDIAKLKWLEGTWHGMDDGEPFVMRFRFEGTTMIVEELSDDTPPEVDETTRFELKDGEFGVERDGDRSVASEITDDHVQFVPVTGGNTFRFERQADGKLRAVLELAEPGEAPERKEYKLEPYKK